MERRDLEGQIRAAFAGVRLGAGVSLRQAAAIDVYGRGWTKEQFHRLPEGEVTDDWTAIPDDELARDCIAHLDPDGLRYYLPAFMVWLLDHYGGPGARRYDANLDMTVIGTISAISPDGRWRERQYQTFDTHFTEQQRQAIAAYVDALPGLVDLVPDDATQVGQSLRDYWSRFLPPGA